MSLEKFGVEIFPQCQGDKEFLLFQKYLHRFAPLWVHTPPPHTHTFPFCQCQSNKVTGSCGNIFARLHEGHTTSESWPFLLSLSVKYKTVGSVCSSSQRTPCCSSIVMCGLRVCYCPRSADRAVRVGRAQRQSLLSRRDRAAASDEHAQLQRHEWPQRRHRVHLPPRRRRKVHLRRPEVSRIAGHFLKRTELKFLSCRAEVAKVMSYKNILQTIEFP